MYVDNTKIFIDVNKPPFDRYTLNARCLVENYRTTLDLDYLIIIPIINKIKVNAKICQAIYYTRKIKPVAFAYSIQGSLIEGSREFILMKNY